MEGVDDVEMATGWPGRCPGAESVRTPPGGMDESQTPAIVVIRGCRTMSKYPPGLSSPGGLPCRRRDADIPRPSGRRSRFSIVLCAHAFL